MSSIIKERHIPIYRFRSENDINFPDWEEIQIGDLCTIYKAAPLSKADISENGTPFILYGELYTTYKEIAYQIVRKTNKVVDKKYYSKIGDVVVPTSGETAEEISTATCIMKEGVILAGDLNIFRSDKIDGRILSYLLNHKKKYEIASIAQGISIIHIKAEDIKKIKINVPCLSEQEKIASFLTSIDNLISVQEENISILETYNKGLISKIFNQEIRFKDENGNNYPDWNIQLITEIATTYIGLVTTMTEHYVSKGVPLIRNSDIKQNKFLFKEPIYLDEKFANQNKARTHKIGDIITVHTGDVGTSAIIDETLDGSLGFATIVTRIKDFSQNSPQYLCMYYNSTIYKNIIFNMITGDGRNNLNIKDFNKIKIPIPCLEEQEKIANFLTSLDNVLQEEKNYLEHLKTIKKGLLQQMFV